MQRPAPRRSRHPSALFPAVLLTAALGGIAEAQPRLSDPTAVTVVAQVHPRITIHDLSAPERSSTPAHALVTRRLVASANVPFAVAVRHPARSAGPGSAIEVRNHRGEWVRLDRGGRVTVLETRRVDSTAHTIECRVAGGAAARDVDCALDVELLSLHPSYPLRVTAPAPAVAYEAPRIPARAPVRAASATGTAGAGVTVYVFDGGISDAHPELAGRVRRGFTAFPGDAPVCNGHGTAVAGAIAGATLGAAPAATVVDVKVIDCWRERGGIDAILHATRWVIEDAARHPNRRAIANWSFLVSTSSSIPELNGAVAALTRAGIPVIVSAGNRELDACRISPANAPDAITVGAAVRRATWRGAVDARVPGTAYGRCVDLYAPGDSVLVPTLDERKVPRQGLWGGTSIAAGYASGTAARFLAEHPRASVEEVAEHLARSDRNATEIAGR